MGVEGQRASTLQPERRPVHGEAQHLERRLERPVGSLAFLADDAVARRDVVAASGRAPAACRRAASARLVYDLQIEDDPASLHLPGFDSAVEDADSLGEGGDMRAGGEAAGTGEGGGHGVGTGQRAPGHPVAAVNVFLQLVGGCQGVEFGQGCDGGRRGRC